MTSPPPRPNRPVYLDNQATTRCDPRVVAAMLPWFTEHYGNPHSVEHVMGTEAEAAVEDARAQVAALIGADAKELVFTSGATESNNIAIKGAARFAQRAGNERRRVITVATEHKCVLESVADLADEGFEPVFLPVRSRRTAGPRHTARGAGGADAAGQRHGGEQRDRRGAGYPGARRDRQAGGGAVPHRHRAGHREDSDRPDGLEGRSGLDQRAQDLRTQGGRRAVCPPPAARAAGAAVLRRRPGARAALRHAARPADRRPGRGLPAGAGRNGGGGEAAGRTARRPAGPAARGDPGCRGERQHGSANPRQPEPDLPGRHRRRSDGARAGSLRLHRLRLLLGHDRAILRAARARPERRSGRAYLALSASDALPRRPISTMRRQR